MLEFNEKRTNKPSNNAKVELKENSSTWTALPCGLTWQLAHEYSILSFMLWASHLFRFLPQQKTHEAL
jgi:hypothetical protein